MKTVEVSESALESLKAMVVQLQSERDELLDSLRDLLGDRVYEYQIRKAKNTIAKCTAKPEVLE